MLPVGALQTDPSDPHAVRTVSENGQPRRKGLTFTSSSILGCHGNNKTCINPRLITELQSVGSSSQKKMSIFELFFSGPFSEPSMSGRKRSSGVSLTTKTIMYTMNT
eukprot:TRINITY_DN22275_c1_g3_i3.p2 TRINITY_DN22275_c1_g3~~TRINITY_DN22275_c1_g3_i3.p2  ORF type:complete len:107 (+),score=0.48 TRINITY_DN22275_c1_g3_i3:668-988(+)